MGVKTVFECDFCGLIDEVAKNRDSEVVEFIKLVSNDRDVPLWFQAFSCKPCKLAVMQALTEFLENRKRDG